MRCDDAEKIGSFTRLSANTVMPKNALSIKICLNAENPCKPINMSDTDCRSFLLSIIVDICVSSITCMYPLQRLMFRSIQATRSKDSEIEMSIDVKRLQHANSVAHNVSRRDAHLTFDKICKEDPYCVQHH